MRLLNAQTLQLETFVGRATPRYAILSHTWGDDEVLFEDVQQCATPAARQSPSEPAGADRTGPARLRRWWSPSADAASNVGRRRHWLAFPRRVRRKAGFVKVAGACARARAEGYGYVWIDTCCIDKGSSAELSEAINSMFKWYAKADVCYAYLVDVDFEEIRATARTMMTTTTTGTRAPRPSRGRGRCLAGGDGNGAGGQAGAGSCPFKEKLRASRWFTRGWTLQELVAPDRVVFLAKGWETLGERSELAPLLSQITGIDLAVLSRNRDPGGGGGDGALTRVDTGISISGGTVVDDADHDDGGDAAWAGSVGCSHSFVHTHGSCTYCGSAVSLDAIMAGCSVATKMSWAAARCTTREEDAAYCLLGLFGIHMPLLYGEGAARAFLRLQEEIIMRGGGVGGIGGGAAGSGGGGAGGGGGGGDQSILASCGVGEFCLPFYQSNLFAAAPGAFAGSRYRVNLAPKGPGHTPLMALTNQGLKVEMLVCPCSVRWTTVSGRQWDLVNLWLGVLDCSLDRDFLSRPAILLERLDEENWTFRRVGYNLLFKVLPNTDKSVVDLVMEDGSPRKFEVLFNHEEVAMRNICLLTSKEFGVSYVTPPLQIKLRQHSNYKLKASYPRNNGNYVPPVEIKARSYLNGAKADDNLSGVLCFDNGASDGFFVAWGIVSCSRTDSGASGSTLSDSAKLMRSPAKVPWCKILEWRTIMGDDYKRDSVQGGCHFTDGELRVRFLNYDAPSRSSTFVDSRVSADERCSPIPVKARISSIDFLGRSALELDVEIDSTG